MNKILLTALFLLMMVFWAIAQVTPIYDIQYTTDPSGDSFLPRLLAMLIISSEPHLPPPSDVFVS